MTNKEESFKDINAELLDAQKAWVDEIVKSDNTRRELKDRDSKGRYYDMLSFPFYFGISQEYMNSSKKKIMIVGQETGGGFDFLNSENEKTIKENKPEISQQWTYAYNDEQRHCVINTSPFWWFVRAINDYKKDGVFPFITCYNNVDKIHFSKLNNHTLNIDSLPLSYSAEKLFSAKYKFKGEEKPLLLREIQILKTHKLLDAIVFVTGPYYDQTMGLALGLSKGEKALKHIRPTENHPLQRISELEGWENRLFWTYHPNYLRLKQKEQIVLSELFEHLSCL